jgi:hypothetical protein
MHDVVRVVYLLEALRERELHHEAGALSYELFPKEEEAGLSKGELSVKSI